MLIQGHADRALDLLPERSVQTVVTSPPYWSLRDYEIDHQIGRDESLEDYIGSLVKTFDKVRRVLKPDGTVWLNLGDAYTSGNRRYRAPDKKNRARAMTVRPPDAGWTEAQGSDRPPLAAGLRATGCGLVASLRNHLDQTERPPRIGPGPPTKAHETVFLLSKSQDYRYNVDAVRGPNGRRLRTAWDIPTEPRKRCFGPMDDHPAVMPATLARRCVELTSKAGSVVLDPFAGSGTTLLAAQYLRRRWVGIELKPAYVDLIQRRFERFDTISTQKTAG